MAIAGPLLLVAPAMPALSGNGLAMRLGIFLEALARLGPIDLFVIPIAGPSDFVQTLPDGLGVSTRVVSIEGRWDTQFAMINRLADPQERLASFRRYGLPSLAAGASAAVLTELKRFIGAKRHEVVHIGRSYLSAASLAVGSGAAVTLDLDEDEVTSYRQLAARHGDEHRPTEAAWMEAEAEGFARLQEKLPGRFRRIFISSTTDEERITMRNPTLRLNVVENGVAIRASRARRDDGRTILFVGSFGYEPNVAGCLWFATKVWPQIRAAASEAVRLRLVGHNPPSAIRDLVDAGGIEVVGPVEDIAEIYEEATVAIAPLHAGTGTRIKVLEAAAFEVSVVATSLAVSGLRMTAPDAIWTANEPDGFAKAVLAALASPEERKKRCGRARRIVEAYYNRDRIIDDLAFRFEDVLAGIGN